MVAVAKRKKRTTAFAQRLRSLREARGLTQGELGERVGMIYQAISRLESGVIEPTWPTVLLLAEALNVSPNDFQGVVESSEDDPEPPRPISKRK